MFVFTRFCRRWGCRPPWQAFHDEKPNHGKIHCKRSGRLLRPLNFDHLIAAEIGLLGWHARQKVIFSC